VPLLTDTEATVGAIITGLAAIISAAGGVLLTVRAVRSKERKAAADELDEVTGELADERRARIEAEHRAHEYHVLLVRNGIDDDVAD
jgi:hypothetical protein